MTERTRIQTELINLCKAGRFFEVTYDADTDLPEEVNILTAPLIPPVSVKCNEIEGQFAVDEKYGLGRVLKPVSWVFECLLCWDNQEVTLEYFLKSLASNVPILAKTSDFRQATLILLNFQVEHPVLQEKSTGTEAKLTFNIELGRN